jgi:hypothetical protein
MKDLIQKEIDLIYSKIDIDCDITYISGCEISILIEPNTRHEPKFEGMQILLTIEGEKRDYEVAEIRVDDNPALMYIYSHHHTIKGALTSLKKGNQLFCKRKPIEVLN